MEAVQEGIDTLASLEERINRAVQVITGLRSDNEQLQRKLAAAEGDLSTARSERDEAQSMSAAFEKENTELEQKIKDLSEELNTLRGERKQVKTRIEKLLSQLDLLSAS
jgi:chromosome segregation ATPase